MRNNVLHYKNNVNPYYILSGTFSGASAGVLVLNLLCHHLNMNGYPAFMTSLGDPNFNTKSGLITPILTQEDVDYHNKNGLTPIMIYPDIVKGNPLNADCVVRYLLHYPGVLGGDKEFSSNDLVFTYSRKIAEKVISNGPKTLFMPVSDTSIFYPASKNAIRSGSCFYADKYRRFYDGELSNITKGSVEITRHFPDSQTTQEVADLLRKSEVFYAYEDTALITEAILCGCPVVLIKSGFFDGNPLSSLELGSEGCSIDFNLENIEKIKKEIPIAQHKFFDAIDEYWVQFNDFVKITQKRSFEVQNSDNISLILPKEKRIPVGRVIKNELVNIFRKKLCKKSN